ncbi:O-antigen polymerase [Salipaludibacillus daqingensis]|uniref:O-antigen polymerase n=1 Tax=Salipaludibacillus daqingensis TaxID=3041001 RepID=UPI0024742821|nr:O-antigen polymerase [Salipaludibacillus daqingensis]
MPWKNRDLKISKMTIITILGISLYRIVLDIVYFNAVSPIFGYTGFLSTFSYEKYILSWIILIIFIPLFTALNNKKSLSSIIIILLFLLSYLPFTTMVAFHPFSSLFIVSHIIYWLVFFIFYKLIPTIKFKTLKNDKLSNFVINIIIFVFVAVVIYISIRYTSFRITFDLLNVYDSRMDARSFNLPTMISYIYAAAKAVNPVLIVYYMARKQKLQAGIVTFIQLLSFSINGSKTVFFTTVLAILLYLIFQNKHKIILPLIFFSINLIALLEVYILNSFLIVAFVIRRVLFVPNLLNSYYFDFFSSNSPDYFRQSFLRHIGFESPYISIDSLIAIKYFNKPEMAANNGLFSDAIANFGFLGVLIMPLLIVFALKILDACTEGLDIKILIISGITLAFIFVSSFFFTVLLTHGFIALCFILYLLPRK